MSGPVTIPVKLGEHGDFLEHVNVKEDFVTSHDGSIEVPILGSAEERRLLWKIDLYLMPTLWVLLILNYADRSNIGNAYIAGMGKTLQMDSHDYYLAVVVFQVAYVTFAIPSNLLLTRVRPSIYIPTLLFLWGSCVACIGAVRTKEQLLAVRFLLGMSEAGFAPAVLYLISSWYRRQEQAKRVLIYFSGSILAGAFGGVAAGGITGRMDRTRGIPGWRWLFIIEGAVTAGVAFIAPFALLDLPGTCRKLKPHERLLALRRVQEDDISAATDDGSQLGFLQAVWLSIRNWRIYFVALPYMQLVGSSALTYFFPALVKGLGFRAVTAQFMTAPIWAVAFVIAIPVAWLGDRIPSYRGLILTTDLVIGATFCAIATGVHNYTARYVFLCFTNAAIWAGSCVAVPYAAEAVAGAPPEVRAVSMAVLTALAQSAIIYASVLFPAEDGPLYIKGFATYTGLLFFGGGVAFAGYVLNKKRPRVQRYS